MPSGNPEGICIETKSQIKKSQMTPPLSSPLFIRNSQFVIRNSSVA